MGYVSLRKSRLQQQLTRVQSQLTALYEMDLETTVDGIKSYSFDSGEGSQKVARRDFTEIQNKIDLLEAKERHLINELSNMGLVSVRLRRKTSSWPQ